MNNYQSLFFESLEDEKKEDDCQRFLSRKRNLDDTISEDEEKFQEDPVKDTKFSEQPNAEKNYSIVKEEEESIEEKREKAPKEPKLKFLAFSYCLNLESGLDFLKLSSTKSRKLNKSSLKISHFKASFSLTAHTCRITVFNTGYITILGLRKENLLHQVIDESLKILFPPKQIPKVHDLRIMCIMASLKLGRKIDLVHLSQKSKNFIYDPEVYGKKAKYRNPDHKWLITIYRTGLLNFIGFLSKEEANTALTEIKPFLRDSYI